jgi:phage shock protein C
MNASAPLHRSTSGRMLAGVSGGLASYLGVDVSLVRIGFVVATLVGGIGVPAYIGCLLLIPEEGSDHSIANSMINAVQGGR